MDPRAAGLASALSFALWALSPALTGRVEPWDAAFPFYSIGAVIVGGIVGLAFPRRLAAAYFGAWLGQLVALLVLPGLDRASFALGAVTTAIGSVVFLGGACVGSALRGRRPGGSTSR